MRPGKAMGGDGRGFGPKTRRDEAWPVRPGDARNLPGESDEFVHVDALPAAQRGIHAPFGMIVGSVNL